MATTEAPATEQVTPGRAAHGTRLLFLASMIVLAAAYTLLAFRMEWRIESGQIGPGFFPRFGGVATIVGCLVAIALTLVGRGAPELSPDPAGDAEDVVGGSDGEGGLTAPWATVLAVGCMVVYFFTFATLGALLSSVL